MSHNTNFIFEGEYCRKPEQNLGGRSKPLQSRDALIQRASEDRSRRERERLVAKSVKTIQAIVRGYLVRCRVKKANRDAYAKMQKDTYTLDELGGQISRINYFYDSKKDGAPLVELGKAIISMKVHVLQKCYSDAAWIFRIRLFLRKAFGSLANNSNVPHAVCIRILEVFTEVSPASFATNESVVFYTNIWLDLIVCSSFFSVWRSQIETRLHPVSFALSTPHIPLASSMINVLSRPLSLISKLETTNLKFTVETNFQVGKPTFQTKTELTPQMVTACILEKFTESFCDHIIPIEKEPRGNGIIPNLVFPSLSAKFPWFQWVNFLKENYCSRFLSGSSQARNIMYAVMLITSEENIMNNSSIFFGPVLKLIHSIDSQFAPVPPIRISDITDDIEDDAFGEPLPADVVKYFQECRVIYFKFAEILNRLPFRGLFDGGAWMTWEAICPLISCLIRLEPRHVSIHFPFLGCFAYDRDFLRNLFIERIHALNSNGNVHDIIVFSWLFTHLMATLHDAEFISGIPMSRDQLNLFIPQLVSVYTETILHERDVIQERLNSSMNKIVANCLMAIHDRNTRMQLFPEEVFYSASLRAVCPVETHNLFFNDFNFTDVDPSPRLNSLEQKLMKVLIEFPFALPFHDRVAAWHRMIDLDRSQRYVPRAIRDHVQIRRNYIYEDAYEKLSPNNVRDLRSHLRISLVNVVGAPEAGVDGGGLLREFLTEATKAGVDPHRGLFRFDSQNRIYPNPIAKKVVPDYRNHYFLIGRLVGKALYEQTLLELPLAAFFIQTCISCKVPSAVDYLATLDPALHKHLLGLKKFSGDLTSLGLDFTMNIVELGETRTVNLKENGSMINVDRSNVIEYIHLVADYKINREMEDECVYFRRGLCDVVPILRMFSWREMQTLISGSDKPINIEDWKAHTNYTGGYTSDHPSILLFWQVIHTFDEHHLRKLLKFVTSCSRPPLLGFKDLVPNFGIQNAGHVDRLPTAATCMNLLKLPEFTDPTLLREKLIYAIDAQAGFELS